MVFRVFLLCLGFFGDSPQLCKIAPPLCVFETPIYRQKYCQVSNLVPQLFFLVNFDFFLFAFFENEQYQHRLNDENQ